MVLSDTSVLFLCLYCVILSVVGQNLVNVAMNKTYRQISKHFLQGPSSNAANGNTSGVYDGNNCIHTNADNLGRPVPNNRYHWWEVDLGRTYPVRDITVWARIRSDYIFYNRLYPFTITVDNQTCVSVTSSPSNSTRNNSVTCSSIMYGRVVRLTLTRTRGMLNMCEFQILECEDGYYKQSAPPCIKCPGTCDNNTPCDKTTGHCQQCPPGKKGDICDQDCQAGLYGVGCSTRCGYCRVNTTCHHQDGRCPEGCVSGFTEPFCLQVKQDADSLIAPVVGSVIGAALIIAVAVVAAVCWHRRSRGEPTEKRATLREPGRTPSTNKTMDSSDHQPPSSLPPQEDTTYYEISDTANTHEMREVQNNYDVLNPYSNDDADKQPYSQLTSHASNVTK